MFLKKLHNHKFIAFIFTAICFTGIFVFQVMAQSSKLTESGVINGVPYSSTDFENINLTNGALNLNFQLAGLQGRGQAGYGYSLRYNSKLWSTLTMPVYNPTYNPSTTYQEFLADHPEGGWKDDDYYSPDLRNRFERMDYPTGTNTCTVSNRWRIAYRWRMEMTFPGGTKVEFRPTAYSDIPPGGTQNDGGYFNVKPDGSVTTVTGNEQNCNFVTSTPNGNAMYYYSADGSGMRLIFGNAEFPGFVWELSMPNGTRIVQLSDRQRIYDRNGNYVETAMITLPDNTQAPGWKDEFGRYIAKKKNTATNEDTYYQQGFNGELLTWKVKWKTIYVWREYTTTCTACGNTRGPVTDEFASLIAEVVERIELPTQLGGLVYTFEYNANDTDTNTPSPGWGEVKSITLPTGAKINYGFPASTSTFPIGIPPRADYVVERAGKLGAKEIAYTETYDGASTNRTETWTYSISRTTSTMTAPDGSVSTQNYWDIVNDNDRGGQVYKETRSGGAVTERIWAKNLPSAIQFGSGLHMNPYVKTEFSTIGDAAGNPSLTAIKDYEYDKNGNVTSVTEYNWVDYNSLPRAADGKVSGIPPGAQVKRTTLTSYYNPTPNAADTTTNALNAYWHSTAPLVRNAAARTEIPGVSVTEITYDNASTTANPTVVRTWDSTKSSTITTPLTDGNSVKTTTQYDSYGNPTQKTDPNGNITDITYGAVNGFAGLYPTEAKSAYNTSVQQIIQTEYDFYTGVTKKVTALGNTASENFVSETEYDALGRATKVKSGVGKAEEVWTTTEYDNVNQWVITRSDVATKGDGKKIAIQHFDQFGRVRLSRLIENALTEDPYNEQHGIKIQKRYLMTSPYNYQLTSNPYRANYSYNATAETTMGWKLERTLNTGKVNEVENFAGADLPQPWGNNSGSTGRSVTETDANRLLVIDQAGKKKISQTNVSGEFTGIWEIVPQDSETVSVSFPNHPEITHAYQTNYLYDALSNLAQINQGAQVRTFTYSSLSRIVSVNNPESGLIQYEYDNNGNTTKRTDARGVININTYDQLNRVTARTYSNESPAQPATPPVFYTYDDPSVPFSRSRLTKVTTGSSPNVLAIQENREYDVTGKIKKSRQTVGTETYPEMEYFYNLAGALIEQKYPSGRIVKNVLDTEGDLAQVESKKNSTVNTFKVYANQFAYTPGGAVTNLRLGNNRFESVQYNSRLQPTQIALGTTLNATNLLDLDYDYGTTNNNGNMLSQTINVPTIAAATGYTATQNYVYDSLNRLKQATETIPSQQGWQQTYSYDRYGNLNFDQALTTTLKKQCGSAPNLVVCSSDRKQENPEIDKSNNKIKEHQDADGVKDYEFDGGGNVRKTVDGNQFVYDGENRQIQVKDAAGNLVGEYFYDGSGKRVKKVAYGQYAETTVFIYDATGRTVAEYSTNPATAAQAQVSYLTNDNLGSARINTDGNGTVTARHDYFPFGEEINRAGSGVDAVRKKFTGYERDKETELDFAQARYHNYGLGRFTTPDPAAFNPASPQEFNRYAYVRNNPLKYIDPSGESLILTGEDADYLLAELARLTGYNLYRCTKDDKNEACKGKKEGQVIIQGKRDESGDKTRKTSAKLAAKLAQVIAPTATVNGKEKEFTVTINTTKNAPDYYVDWFRKKTVDTGDLRDSSNVKNPEGVSDNGAFVAGQLGHVLEEYFQAETTFANERDTLEQGENTTPRFNKSHAAGLKVESEILSDFTGQPEKPREEDSRNVGAYYNYSSVFYTVFFKTNGNKDVMKIDRKPVSR